MIVTIVGWMLGLVALYILVTQYKGATSIATSSAGASVSVLKALQGR